MFGLTIVQHTLAREVRDEWKVEACQTRKRRRNWRVVKHHIDRPGAYQIGNTIYMHPDLVAKLKEVTPNGEVSRPAAPAAEVGSTDGLAAASPEPTFNERKRND